MASRINAVAQGRSRMCVPNRVEVACRGIAGRHTSMSAEFWNVSCMRINHQVSEYPGL